MYTKTAMTDTFFCLFLSMNIYAEKAPSAGKYMQTRVRRRCLDRVLYGLMHRYDEPGVRTCSHEFYSTVGAPHNPITKCNQKQKRKFNQEENLAKKKL